MTSRLTIIAPSLNGFESSVLADNPQSLSHQNLARGPDVGTAREKPCVKGKLESEGKEISIATGLKCTRHKDKTRRDLPEVCQDQCWSEKDLFLVEILEEASNGIREGGPYR